ncbi:MAG: hypothetical protein JWS12_450 [Candidatus Saccharibacteria bacterium]|nr:hypothetical protein [Candidatus Saccharibacteria bacterium]
MKKPVFWVAAAVLLTIGFMTMYVVAQQVLRQSANDPQSQLAEDAVASLNEGEKPANVVSGKVDLAASLAPFVIVYDKHGSALASSGYLDNKIPVVPIGVLQHASSGRNNVVTWQPAPGVRLATVTAAANDYYVLSGRSLRMVEKRESNVLHLAALGWVASLVALGGTFIVQQTKQTKHRRA